METRRELNDKRHGSLTSKLSSCADLVYISSVNLYLSALSDLLRGLKSNQLHKQLPGSTASFDGGLIRLKGQDVLRRTGFSVAELLHHRGGRGGLLHRGSRAMVVL